MNTIPEKILTINAGSSSIKFALYNDDTALTVALRGQMEGMGTENTILSYQLTGLSGWSSMCIDTSGNIDAGHTLINWLMKQDDFNSIKFIGHRIVYGMQYSTPKLVDQELLDDLKTFIAYDPEHMPEEIRLIELFRERYPQLPQIACFDTAFHAAMPAIAQLLPLPRKYTQNTIRRYGFHGVSYAYLMQELERVTDKKTANGKIILAHLGNGASLCAVQDGKSVETTMGFTPASGLPMGTRTGDIDPGIAWFLMKEKNMSPQEFNHLINHESGMLAISGSSADMRDLLKIKATNEKAAAAIEFFCYQTKKFVGAFAAVLGGLNTLVFSGGIGEHAPEIRAGICKDLRFLGIEIDEARNDKSEAIISTDASAVCVRVIPTDEQIMIARSANAIWTN